MAADRQRPDFLRETTTMFLAGNGFGSEETHPKILPILADAQGWDCLRVRENKIPRSGLFLLKSPRATDAVLAHETTLALVRGAAQRHSAGFVLRPRGLDGTGLGGDHAAAGRTVVF